MRNDGFENDAAYFDIIAKQSNDPTDRHQLREVAEAYRLRSKGNGTGTGSPRTRREHWQSRADECRRLLERFGNPTCRTQLQRLADTYDMMAANSDLAKES
jgi:hypothetical protein